MEEVQITLTTKELDTVLQCVAEQPYKVVHGIIAKILNQANSRPQVVEVPGDAG